MTRLATLVLLAIVAPGCTPGQTSEMERPGTAAYFERIRHDPVKLDEFLDGMPLGADLHHHAGGGVRPASLIRFAADYGLCLPEDPESVWKLEEPPCTEAQRPVAEALEDAAFHTEIERRWSMQDYLANDPTIDRSRANDYFFGVSSQYRLALRDFARVLAAARSLAAQQGVIYLETSTGFARDRAARAVLISSIPWNNDLLELRKTILADPRFHEIRDATVAAIPGELTRSEEILACDTPDADPGCDVFVRFQAILVRTSEPKTVFVRLVLAYEIAQASPLVVGINFAGPETDEVSVRDYELHMKMFGQMAKLYPEVRLTLHAGEMTIGQAQALGADNHISLAIASPDNGGAAAHRVGHGVALNAEPNKAQLLQELKQRGIAVEINLESNRQLLGVGPDGHPFLDYLESGVPIVLCTDDPGPMISDLRQQFALAARNEEVTYQTLKTLALNSISYSFLPSSDKQRLQEQLRREFDAFESTLWK